MALADVRPFFRTRLEGLGFEEHTAAFDIESIGDVLLDEAYFLTSEDTAGSGINQRTLDFTYPIKVSLFKRGFEEASLAVDALDALADTVLADILAPSVRIGTDIKDIVITNIARLPLAESNDNSMILELSFEIKLVECFD